MSSYLALLLMMNNYLHDVATALLAASGCVIWVLWHHLGSAPNLETQRYFVRMYYAMTRLARFSFAWIILGGIPRTIFYTEFEWSNMAGRGQIPALIVKHIVAFILVGAGIMLWRVVRKKVLEIEEQLMEDQLHEE
ncbi:MAG TPA: hypothetical protein VIR63_00135 [Pontiella sp.]